MYLSIYPPTYLSIYIYIAPESTPPEPTRQIVGCLKAWAYNNHYTK